MAMALPINFWEEFDRRLDLKLDKRFDMFEAKLDIKFKKIDERFVKIEKSLKTVINWTQRQDRVLENEMSDRVKTHLMNQQFGFITVVPTIFPRRLNGSNGLELTEFDGLVVLTNSHKFTQYLSPEKGATKISLAEIPEDTKAYIIIIEAKEHFTSARFKKKIQQKNAIEKILLAIKKKEIEVPRELKHVGIEYFDTTVGLYFGSSELEKALENEISEYIKGRPMTGMIRITGSRFNVEDESNDYGNMQSGAGAKPKYVPPKKLIKNIQTFIS